MILVTGGTGLVGAHLLLALVQNNNAVRAVHRNSGNLKQVETVFSYYVDNAQELFRRIEWVHADITDIPALETAFMGVTRVYHCAALISFDPQDHDLLCKTNAEGTANIVNLCIAHKIIKLCYVSSIATIGKQTGSDYVDEETEWSPRNANVYALSKYDAEMEVWRASVEKVPVVIVNPGVILGPGYWHSGSGLFFADVAKNRRYYPPGGTGFVAVEDVVKMMVLLMDSDIENERFIAVSKNMTYKEAIHKISLAMGLRPPVRKLKMWQLEIIWRLDFFRCFVTGSSRKLTRTTVRSLQRNILFDTKKIKDSTGFAFGSLEETIKFSAREFIDRQP